MGWTWNHAPAGTGHDGHGDRSYTAHGELGDELRGLADRTQWVALAVLFGRVSGDPFDVLPEHAGRIAEALTQLAPFVSGTWTAPVRQLAAAARGAHRAGAVWHWS